LKEKTVTALILAFPDWGKEFHVRVDALCITLGKVLTQVNEGELDHPIAFARRKLSKAENNYSTIKLEGWAMLHALQRFRDYLLGEHFKVYKDNFALKYLVNKLVLGGDICRWLLLSHEYDFEVIVKLERLNVGPYHLSCIAIGEEPTNLEEGLPNV